MTFNDKKTTGMVFGASNGNCKAIQVNGNKVDWVTNAGHLGNYREIRTNLAHIDWDEKMKNKTATERWDILRGELDTAIDSYVPMKKQGKRSKKKQEAFRKMRYKQNMWRVYKHTGKDKDYEVYKEALNAATN